MLHAWLQFEEAWLRRSINSWMVIGCQWGIHKSVCLISNRCMLCSHLVGVAVRVRASKLGACMAAVVGGIQNGVEGCGLQTACPIL